jgi:hypothetical protein
VTDHERIDELLAGYVLRSLSGPDEAEADRLLADHVPRCGRCRSELADLREVASDLALSAPPIEAPETLLPRLVRQLEPRQQRRHPRTRLALAASVVAVFGLAGTWMQGQIAETGTRRDALATILAFARDHDAQMEPVGRVTRVAAPDVRHMYLYGEHVPSPPDGTVYGVWLVTDGTPRLAGTFVPDGGWVYLRVTFDAAADELWITLEPEDADPTVPGRVLWRAP